MLSVVPAGGIGTINRTGLVGHSCAKTLKPEQARQIARPADINVLIDSIIVSLRLLSFLVIHHYNVKTALSIA
jgi:hypothetical protein